MWKTGERQERLAPAGIPRWVRCYDNGGRSADRYTVVFTGRYTHKTGGEQWVLGMCASPFSPQGVGMHSSYRHGDLMEGNKPNQWPPAIGRRGNLGVRIAFTDLPEDCQRAAWQDYANLWDLVAPA